MARAEEIATSLMAILTELDLTDEQQAALPAALHAALDPLDRAPGQTWVEVTDPTNVGDS